jgi:acetyl esterase/lipase
MRRIARVLAASAAGILALAVVLWWIALPTRPEAFYAYADALPAPGTLIRSEPLGQDRLPPDSRGYRLLYVTTRPDGTPVTASAVVVVPSGPGQAPVVAYAHGTTGVRPGCAPSLFDNPFPNVPGFPALFDQGWAYVATDYAGLGTGGGHFYLVGEDAARAVLDSITAARQVPGLDLAPETVVWGHSQGGHSALWAAMRAAELAPGIDLRGVAAVSPASDLPALARAAPASGFGRIVAAYLMAGYAAAYPGLDTYGHAPAWARPILRDLGRRCIELPGALVSLGLAALLPAEGFFRVPPDQGALGDRLAGNVPRGPFAAPVLLGQGATDGLVLPAVQEAYVRGLCAAGNAVDYRLYPGQDHVSIVGPASPFVADLIAWTADRFAGRPAAAACPA